jgi:hypothetical protein
MFMERGYWKYGDVFSGGIRGHIFSILQRHQPLFTFGGVSLVVVAFQLVMEDQMPLKTWFTIQ